MFFIEENELKKISLGWKDGSNYLLNSFSSDKQQELSDLSIGLSEANTKIGNLERDILTLQSDLNNISLTPGPKGEKGDTGSQGPAGISAGFGTPTATIDSNIGTPSVTVTTSGSDTAKVFNFAFKNLRGATGSKGDSGIFYGYCNDAGNVSAKTVVCNGFSLVTGAVVAVKFTYINNVSNPTLNVNGTGAKSIKKYDTIAPEIYYWRAGAVVEFVYDGNYYVMINGTTATTSYYGVTKLYNGTGSTSSALAATANSVRLAYDRAGKAIPKNTMVTISTSDWVSSSPGYIYSSNDAFFLPNSSSLTYEDYDFIFSPRFIANDPTTYTSLLANWHCISKIGFEYSNSSYSMVFRCISKKPTDTIVINCTRLRSV